MEIIVPQGDELVKRILNSYLTMDKENEEHERSRVSQFSAEALSRTVFENKVVTRARKCSCDKLVRFIAVLMMEGEIELAEWIAQDVYLQKYGLPPVRQLR